MLINLLKFEALKKWKSMRYILLAYFLIELILLVSCKIVTKNLGPSNPFPYSGLMNVNSINGSLVFTTTFFMLFACILFIFPFFEGVIRFAKDLSGKQAALELMLPAHSWKKIFSKLVITVASAIICGLIAGISILIFILVISNFDTKMINTIFDGLKEMLSHPLDVIIVFVSGFFNYASMYLLFYFCIAIANSISNKNKIAIPISIVAFIISVVVLYNLQGLSEKHPIFNFNISTISSSLSSLLLNILSFAVMFFASTWLMENKIEN